VREVFEEIGLRLDPELLEGPVHEQVISVETEDGPMRQHETFFRARCALHEVDTSGFTAFEVATIGDSRWWTRAELLATTERVAPDNLLALLEARQ
jgi:8-oxo-dGTP pyrophosphatase MutT (NUDIX family)